MKRFTLLVFVVIMYIKLVSLYTDNSRMYSKFPMGRAK
jgi:hypothetical protein